MMKDKVIIQNEIECFHCGDWIFSAHQHDYVSCSCGGCSVDGGRSYLRRTGQDWVERSMFLTEEQLKDCTDAVRWADENSRNYLGTALAVIRSLNENDLLTEEVEIG